MRIDITEQIYFNPLYTSKLLLMALSGAHDRKLKRELIFLILPLIYNDITKKKLANSNKKSTWKTFLNTEVREELIKIEALIKNYREKTNEALIALGNYSELEISSYIVLKEGPQHYNTEKDEFLRESYKASYNFGSILSKEKYIKILYNL